MKRKMAFVLDPARRRPVMYDVDVVVAGAGLCGTFAAIAAARCGASVLVIERFGHLGGNIGPGMVVNGGLYVEADSTLPGGLSGIAKEFISRLEALRTREPNCYPEEASIASHLAYEMMKEAGVRFLLSAYAADPIVKNGVVKGLFVETASGRVAVRAKVTIDGTGTGEIARRAGARMVSFFEAKNAQPEHFREPYRRQTWPTLYNDTQLYCLIAGANLRRFEKFIARKDVRLSPEDKKWSTPPGALAGWPLPLIRPLRLAWQNDAFRPYGDVMPNVRYSTGWKFVNHGEGVAGMRVSCVGAFDIADAAHVSAIEGFLREVAFKAVAFFRKNAQGFEKAHLLCCAPFLGARGGPHVLAEHILTPQEMFSETRFDDVLYRNTHEKNHGAPASGFDVPYRAVLPKGLDGLLVCGRGAAYSRRGHDPTGMRARPSMMVFGQCVGTAAAIAALDGVTPKKVNIRKVQRRLLKDGIVLGEPERLKQLGIR